VQAYFDGEVDAVSAAAIEAHLQQCAECRELLASLQQTRSLIRRDLTYGAAPSRLRARIMAVLDQEAVPVPVARSRPNKSLSRTPPFWFGALSGIMGTGTAAVLAFVLWFPSLSDAFVDDLVAAHVRSLMPSHLIDVVSTDQHTVKPWFAGHADVSPVVADFEQQGYRLVGGRADYLDHQRPAVVVYQHGKHVINVFSWAESHRSFPNVTTRNGYRMAFWREGNLEYCAVSDTGWDELLGLVRLLQDLSSRDAPRSGSQQ
jgi:anti-sigma factor RsiW